MKVMKLSAFTAYGAASGFVLSGVGGAILDAAHSPSHGGPLDDALVGAVGGAVVNALAGAVAAFSPHYGVRHDLAEGATSTLAVGALGGLVGARIMGDSGHVDPRHAFLAGAVGTAVLVGFGAFVWTGLCACRVAFCCCRGPEHALARLQTWLAPGYRPIPTDDLAEDV